MGVVITVSRQLGSQGSYMATEVARRLDYRYLDREILQRAAEIAGYPDEQMVRALAEREQTSGFLQTILNSLNTMPPVPSVPSATLREGYAYADIVSSMVSEEVIAQQERERAATGYADLVREVIQSYAETGDVVIAGRGGQVILRNRRNALHIRVFAPLETRIRTLITRQQIGSDEAETRIRKSDRQRARYLQRLHDVDWDDPNLYHLVINSGEVPVPMGASIIVEAARWVASTLST
ncbi:MAG: AAA family ATPase [Anaerolineae bacterium]